MDSKKCLVNSLKKLGLVAPIALAAGPFSSVASADFSPIGEPFKGDSFFSVGVGAQAAAFGDLVKFETIPLTAQFGKNFFNEDGLVAGAVAGITTDKIDLKEGSVGAYVAYNANPDSATGLKLGLVVNYVRDISKLLGEEEAPTVAADARDAAEEPAADSENTDATPSTPHFIKAKASQSYTLELAEFAGSKVFLTQSAEVNVKKALHDEKVATEIDGKAGLKLSSKFGAFSPFVAVEAAKPFGKVDAAADKVSTSLGGGVALDLAEFGSLALSVSKDLAEKGQYKANLGLGLLF